MQWFNLIEHLGWLGSLCLALCGIPQAVDSLVRGHSRGINSGFLALWFLGELFTLTYVLPKNDVPLIINYSINLICLLVIIRYRIFPRPSYERMATPMRRVK